MHSDHASAAQSSEAGPSAQLAARETVAIEELEISRLRMAVMELERELSAQDDELAQLGRQHAGASANLDAMQSELADLTAQLQLRQRDEMRRVSTDKLLQLQLTVATQLYGVADQGPS